MDEGGRENEGRGRGRADCLGEGGRKARRVELKSQRRKRKGVTTEFRPTGYSSHLRGRYALQRVGSIYIEFETSHMQI